MLCFITILSLGLALAHGESSQVQAYGARRPELVSVLVIDSFANPMHTCSGFIIHSQAIATAGRCLYDKDGEFELSLHHYRFRAGSQALNSGGIVYNVWSEMRFLDFHPSNMNLDLAILWTSFTILFSDTVRPAAIGAYHITDGEPVQSVGWGYLTYPGLFVAEFEVQNEIQQVTVDWEECRSIYANNGFVLLEDTFCTELGNQSAITNPEVLRQKCFGEAGGPVYHNGFVVGIRSFDVNCTEAIPTVNTRTSDYISVFNNTLVHENTLQNSILQNTVVLTRYTL